MKKEKKEDYENELQSCYDRWNYLYKHGGSDPFWPDGSSLNLVRNHIMWYKRRLEEENRFPDVYYRAIPPEVDNSYMARVDEILSNSARSLSTYKNDANYQFLIANVASLSKKELESISCGNILGYVSGIESLLSEFNEKSERERTDALVSLRRHEDPGRDLESFARCRKGMEILLAKRAALDSTWCLVEETNGQFSLF